MSGMGGGWQTSLGCQRPVWEGAGVAKVAWSTPTVIWWIWWLLWCAHHRRGGVSAGLLTRGQG
jgi:hypothetical protein